MKKEIPTLPTELDFYTQWLTQLREHGDAEYKVALSDRWEVVAWDSPDVWLKSVLDYRVPQPELGKSTVYDWKSGKVYPDHDDQKHLYALTEFAAEPTLLEVDSIHVYLDLGKTTKRTYRREWVDAGQRKWEQRVTVMEEDKMHIPNPTYLCRFCGFSRFKGGPCRF